MFNLKQEYIIELHNIFRKYCPDSEIWAYGSRVDGNSHSGSDLDLVVITFNDNNKNLSKLKQLLNDSDLPFLIDITEFDSLPEYFKEEIKKKYIVLYPNVKF